jgi:hypothetical protein
MSDKAWRNLERAQDAYLRAGDVFLAGKPVEELREVFARGHGHHAALRLISDRAPDRPELVQELLPELFNAALDINPYAERARCVIAGLRPDLRDSQLEALASREIANPHPDRWAHLRGLAMLLEQVGRFDILGLLQDAVRDSPDEDLRWIAEEFPEYS